MAGTRGDIVRDGVAGEQVGGVPAEREGMAGGAVAAGISGLAGHAGSAGGVRDDAGFGESGEEAAFALGGPAVVALGRGVGRGWGHVPGGEEFGGDEGGGLASAGEIVGVVCRQMRVRGGGPGPGAAKRVLRALQIEEAGFFRGKWRPDAGS